MKTYRPSKQLKKKPILVSGIDGRVVCLGGKTDKYPEASQADYKLYYTIFSNRKQVKDYILYDKTTKPDTGRDTIGEPDLSADV